MTTHPGFHSLAEERAETLTVRGTLPDWLTGTLIRNGPGAFEFESGAAVDHWFDGLAMLSRYTFDPGGEGAGDGSGDARGDGSGGARGDGSDEDGGDAVHYRNRFLRTDALRSAVEGAFDGGFATGETTLRDRLASFLTDPYDNTNIVVERIGGRYVALTESPRGVVVDPADCSTLGNWTADGDPSGQLACAHLKRDPATGTLLNVETEFGRTGRYHVYALTSTGERRHVGTVGTEKPAYTHSFALTPRYVVLTEFPLRLDPTRLLRPGRQDPFIEQFDWEPDRGTRVVVLDRTTGETVADTTTGAVFGFHHVNAYERAGGTELVFDLETVPDAGSIDSLYLDSLRAGDLDTLAGRLDRFTVRLDADGPGRYGVDGATVERERLAEGTALPTVSPARWCRRHRYVYAMSMDYPVEGWARGVLKHDTETGRTTEHDAGGDFFVEPIFVPAPDADAEDDGVVVTVALDADADRSRVLVLDGETLAERARATLPHAVPFDFHGRYFPEIGPATVD